MINHYLKTLLTSLTAISLALTVLAGCSSSLQRQPPPQQTLTIRINQYYTALHEKAYAKSSLFHAHRHDQNSTDPSSLASKLSLDMAAYEVQSMDVADPEARVVMHVTLSGNENQYEIMVLDHWRFISGEWYVVDAGHESGDEAIEALHNRPWQDGINW